MQIHQLYQVDKNTPFIVACSGGVDSMAVVDFYKRGGKNFKVAYYHHGTPQADSMQELVEKWCKANEVEMIVDWLPDVAHIQRPSKFSPEEWMRNWRYAFLRDCSLRFNSPIITAHHLNDVAETWIFSSINGNPKLIPANIECFYRPFLLNDKLTLEDWCRRHDVSWVEDSSNKNVRFPRNRIRHNILPECIKVNPGLLKTLKKKYSRSLGSIVQNKQTEMFSKHAQVAER